jgi:DNA-binding response OmpR family regulator
MATILVIDDDAGMRRTLVRMLSGEHHLFEAKDGSDGLAQFAAHRPDLVITDIVMPKKEGIETILELRRQSPKVLILAISGGGDIRRADYLDMAGKLGADATLTKPVMAAELREAVNRLLSGSWAATCAP